MPITPADGWPLVDRRRSRYDDDDDDDDDNEATSLKYPTASALSLVGGAACSTQDDDDRTWGFSDSGTGYVDGPGALDGATTTPEVFPATPLSADPRNSPLRKLPCATEETQEQVAVSFSS